MILTPRNVLLLIGLALCCTVAARAQDAEETTTSLKGDILKRTVQVWRDREDHVRSLRFEWSETRTDPPEIELAYRTERLSPEAARRVPMPPERKRERKLTLSLQGSMMRYETEGPLWSQLLQDYAHTTYLSTFDGTIEMGCYSGEIAGQKAFAPSGVVVKRDHHVDADSLECRALVLAFRPLHKSLGEFNPDAWVLRGDEQVNGRRCGLIGEKTPGTNARWYWIDLQRSFVVVRMATQWEGRASVQLDISYEQDKNNGWVPVGWQATRFRSGKSRTWFTAKVTRYEINVPIPRTEFQLVFPAGTWVNDRVQKCDYLVRSPNHRRIITQEEMDACATYAEVSKTESGRAVPAEYKVLLSRAFHIAAATSEERQQFIEAVKAKALAAGHSGWPPRRCSLLVRLAAQHLDAAGQTEMAIQLCHSFAQLLPDCGRDLVAMANRLNAAAQRNAPQP